MSTFYIQSNRVNKSVLNLLKSVETNIDAQGIFMLHRIVNHYYQISLINVSL